MSTAAWDDPQWKESDTAWRAGCRWLQSWWRETKLGLPPGPLYLPKDGVTPRRTDPVASMLPLDVEWSHNFLTPEAERAALRLAPGTGSGIVDGDRLLRNLLGSQAVCVNMFAPLADHPQVVADWLTATIPGLGTIEVTDVTYEWAPERAEHFGGGSAFDAFVTYRTHDGSTGFVGIETKYSENLADGAPKHLRDTYIEFTRTNEHWRPGASDRLQARELQQLWLNALLGHSLMTRGTESFDRGDVLVMTCAADTAAIDATARVAAEQHEQHPVPLRWTSYEALIEASRSVSALDRWRQAFTERYLDWTPVHHLLSERDPRRSEATPHQQAYGALREALSQFQESALRGGSGESVVQRTADAEAGAMNVADILVTAALVTEASEALRSARRRVFVDHAATVEQ